MNRFQRLACADNNKKGLQAPFLFAPHTIEDRYCPPLGRLYYSGVPNRRRMHRVADTTSDIMVKEELGKHISLTYLQIEEAEF